jgi:hypothetical protein
MKKERMICFNGLRPGQAHSRAFTAASIADKLMRVNQADDHTQVSVVE